MDTRKSFEQWYSGDSPRGLDRTAGGGYKYMPANVAWGVWQAATADEREACAKACEDWGRECHGEGRDDSEAFDCADHIRARSNA